MEQSAGNIQDVKYFGEGTFEKPKIKFYFLKPCPSLGIESGSSLTHFGQRPAFQFVSDQFSCDVCGQKFTSGVDVVTHWQQETRSQSRQLGKVDIPCVEIKHGLEYEREDTERSNIVDKYLDIKFYEKGDKGLINEIKEDEALECEDKNNDEESKNLQLFCNDEKYLKNSLNHKEKPIDTLQIYDDENNTLEKDFDGIKVENDISSDNSSFIGNNEAIMKMEMQQGAANQVSASYLGSEKKTPMTDAERKRVSRAKTKREGKVYKCKYESCDYNTVHDSLLRRHIKNVHELIRYDCTFCDLKGIGDDGLRKHNSRKHKEYKFVLKEHKISESVPDTVEKPKDYHKEGDDYVCKICNHRSQIYDSIRVHIKRKHEDKTCNFCSYKAINLPSLKEHANSEHGGLLYPCKSCDKNLVSKESLRRHELEYHSELTDDLQYCELCDFQSHDKYQLKRHFQSAHSNRKSFQCSHCEYVGKTKQRIVRHEQNKHGVNGSLYYCDQCDFTSSYITSLNNHKKWKHDQNWKDERETFKCDYCDFVTKNKPFLQTHIDSKHLGIKHNCDECDFAGASALCLIAHKNSQHLGVKYPCDQCDYKASQKGSLNLHKKAKHENIRFYCSVCDFSASFKGNLRVHMKKCHDTNQIQNM